MISILFVFLLSSNSLSITAYPTDDVVSRQSPGPRYQYMSAPDGAELVDTWITTSDLLSSASYNPAEDNKYHLFTRHNPQVSQPIPYGADEVLKASHYDPGKKTVFIVHGWRNTPTSNFNVQTVNAYLTAEDINLFLTDWSVGALNSYIIALMNSIRSAPHVASYIEWLNSASGTTLQNYHLVGHSLGGHQVGIIGRQLGGQVAYITALDPALPGWITNPHSFRRTDGLYTEVIHTDVGYSGILLPAGDVDFYPNGGRAMPGCGGDNNCSHHRCVFYMAESLINGGGFTGRRCDSLASALKNNCTSTETLKMGGAIAKTASFGIYYVETNAAPPFSQD